MRVRRTRGGRSAASGAPPVQPAAARRLGGLHLASALVGLVVMLVPFATLASGSEAAPTGTATASPAAIPSPAASASPAATPSGLEVDTDGDGLIDAAEDLDGDGLSWRAEQRFGTDPLDPDSDADGTPDGADDSDLDGTPDGRQQDQRPLPGKLRPTLQQAWWDRPANYDDRCHNDAVDPGLHPCSFGAQDSDVDIVLFGDSHALQWLPALMPAAERLGWRVTTLTKAACPPGDVEFGRKEPGAGESCRSWRRQALDWLGDQPPDLLLLTGAGREYNLVDAAGERLPDEVALAAWSEALADTLAAVQAPTQAVVLADTPLMSRNPVSCLEEHPGDQSACVTPRREALAPGLDEAERATAETAGAAFESLSELVCPYDPCPVIIGDVLLWRNADHITATFAAQLEPAMRALLLRNLPPGADQRGGD